MRLIKAVTRNANAVFISIFIYICFHLNIKTATSIKAKDDIHFSKTNLHAKPKAYDVWKPLSILDKSTIKAPSRWSYSCYSNSRGGDIDSASSTSDTGNGNVYGNVNVGKGTGRTEEGIEDAINLKTLESPWHPHPHQAPQEVESQHPDSIINDEQTSRTNHLNFHDRHSHSHRHLTRNEERAILGRAVLTTPHRRMPAISIAPGPRPPFLSPRNPGPIFSNTPIYATKSTLCKSLNCALRDLRIIDQFSNNGASRYAGPAFLARRNCIIVNVGHVRAIVMRDQVLIFVPWEQHQHNVNGNSNVSVNISDSDDSSENSKLHDVIQTIDSLVEALVTHLNSIYHASHHLMVDDYGYNGDNISNGHGYGGYGSAGEYLASRYDTSMSQQWGSRSGWYPPSTLKVDVDLVGRKKDTDEKDKDNHLNVTDRKNKRKRKNWKSSSDTKDQNNDNDTTTRTQKSQTQTQQKQTLSFAPSTKAPPFELVVIEALLGHVCSYESSKASQLIRRAKDVLSGITHSGGSSGADNSNDDNNSSRKKDAFLEMQRKLGELLPLKNKVDELEAKCSEVASAIAEVLKNDEDMAAMRLSEIAALQDLDDDDSGDKTLLLDERGDVYNLHVEVELLFEDYLLQMDEVLHSLRSVQSAITNTEEVVEIELDLLRNRIMRYEMLLELSGLVVGVAAAVTGAFGMNLINHMEERPWMFYQVSLTLIVLMGVMGYAVLRKLSIDNIL